MASPILSVITEKRTDGNGITRAYVVIEGLSIAPNGVETLKTNAAGTFVVNGQTAVTASLADLIVRPIETLTIVNGLIVGYTVP